MAALLEYVGCVHIFLGPYRGNPIALYLKRTDSGCQIGPKVYPWNGVVGIGETPNKAAADFEEKWKARGLTTDMYSGPAWEGGIKPERPAPPKPAAPPKPVSPPEASSAPVGHSASPLAAPSDRSATASVTGGEPSPAPQPITQPKQTTAAPAASAQPTIAPAQNPQPSGRPS